MYVPGKGPLINGYAANALTDDNDHEYWLSFCFRTVAADGQGNHHEELFTFYEPSFDTVALATRAWVELDRLLAVGTDVTVDRHEPDETEAPVAAAVPNIMGDIDVGAVEVGEPVPCPACGVDDSLRHRVQDETAPADFEVYEIYCTNCLQSWPL